MDRLDAGSRSRPLELSQWQEALAPVRPPARRAVVAESERFVERKAITGSGAAPRSWASEELSLKVLYVLADHEAPWSRWTDLVGTPRILVTHRVGAHSSASVVDEHDADDGITIDGVSRSIFFKRERVRPDVFGAALWSRRGVVSLRATGPAQACSVEVCGYDTDRLPLRWQRVPTDEMDEARKRLMDSWA